MDLKQILSLYNDGVSNRQIGELLSVSRNTVNNYIKLARASDYSTKELLAMESHELGELFTAHTTLVTDRFNELMTWFDKVNQQRNHPGFTFMFHYLEYRNQVSNPYSYTQFMEHYHRKYDKVKGSMKLEHEAGKEMYIDFAGKNITTYHGQRNRGTYPGRSFCCPAAQQPVYLCYGMFKPKTRRPCCLYGKSAFVLWWCTQSHSLGQFKIGSYPGK